MHNTLQLYVGMNATVCQVHAALSVSVGTEALIGLVVTGRGRVGREATGENTGN